MARAKRVTRSQPKGSAKRPSPDAIVRGLTKTGLLNPRTTLAQVMTKAAQIERELGGVAVTVVYDTDKYAFIVK